MKAKTIEIIIKIAINISEILRDILRNTDSNGGEDHDTSSTD